MKNYRFEKKFIVNPIYYDKIINSIELSGWTKIFPKRKVNNIYLDSINSNSYYECKNGDLEKTKYRIRWYGNTFPKKKIIKSCFFENKIKKNNLNRKVIRNLRNIEIYLKQPYSRLSKNVFAKLSKIIPEEEFIFIENYIIQFISCYDREYYKNSNNKIRLTIDRNQNYFKVDPIIKHETQLNSIVIELKYSSDEDFRNFSLQTNLTHNSKYQNGIDLLFNGY